MLLSLSELKSITNFRIPAALGVNSSLAVASSLGPTVPTLRTERSFKGTLGSTETSVETGDLRRMWAIKQCYDKYKNY